MKTMPKVGEIWKNVDVFNYAVSDQGRVKNLRTGRYIGSNRNGYRAVELRQPSALGGRRQTILVHALVLHYFVGPRPPGKYINHKNFNRADNRLENIEYCTPKENSEHAAAHRRMTFGSNQPNAKINEWDVTVIKACYAAGMSHRQIARAYGVDRKVIAGIFKKKTWKYAEETLLKRKLCSKCLALISTEEVKK